MNREDIIRMAREAGFEIDCCSLEWHERIQRFAALVAAHERDMCAKLVEEMVKHDDGLDDFANSVRKGGRRLCSDGRPKWLKISMEVAAEREACARIADTYGGPKEPAMVGDMEAGAYNAAEAIAADIRARGEEPKRHPGYIIGDHWLQAAYTRVCTGEDIRVVMEDYGYYP